MDLPNIPNIFYRRGTLSLLIHPTDLRYPALTIRMFQVQDIVLGPMEMKGDEGYLLI
jgi:hypothetical protein